MRRVRVHLKIEDEERSFTCKGETGQSKSSTHSGLVGNKVSNGFDLTGNTLRALIFWAWKEQNSGNMIKFYLV
jgi:hypothetical protein